MLLTFFVEFKNLDRPNDYVQYSKNKIKVE